MAEVIKYAVIPNGGSLRIDRGGMAGWVVYINGADDRIIGQMAAFSNSDDLLDWLKKSICPTARDPVSSPGESR